MMALIESYPPLSAVLPSTRYFEIDSHWVGARFSVWVTFPAGYTHDTKQSYPAIYVVDGNVTVPQTACFHMLQTDPIYPIQAFIHVGIGYCGEEAQRQLAVRARDLLPPGEPIPAGVTQCTLMRLVDRGLLDPRGAQLYWQNLQAPSGDRFLAFLGDELHPHLVAHCRIRPDTAGLFGYSYGGLFAIYASLMRPSLFTRIGAGSPAILPRMSSVFQLYERQCRSKHDYMDRCLHVTICDAEFNVPSYFQQLVAQGTYAFIQLAESRPLPGVRFSYQRIPLESHFSGLPSAWFSFLRNCYARENSSVN